MCGKGVGAILPAREVGRGHRKGGGQLFQCLGGDLIGLPRGISMTGLFGKSRGGGKLSVGEVVELHLLTNTFRYCHVDLPFFVWCFFNFILIYQRRRVKRSFQKCDEFTVCS